MNTNISVLVVDDEVDIRIFVHAVLSTEFSCQFFEAENASKAIEILSQQKVDLIICDYNMPNGNGDLVFNYSQKLNPQPRFILFTGDDQEVHQDFIQKSGCIFLQKPFRFKDLSDLTSNVLNIIPIAKDNHKFTTFDTATLLKYDNLPFDLYVKLGSSHQIKYINGHRPFSNSDKERLKKLNVNEVYIESNLLKEHLIEKERVVFQSLILPQKAVAHKFQLSEATPELNGLGLKAIVDNKELSDLTQNNLKTVFALTVKSKAFKGLIDWVESNEANTKKMHAILITLFCNIILKNWKSCFYDFKTYLYFGYAAVLHNISLDNFYIKNEYRILNAIKMKSPISKDEQAVVLNHVDESLKIAREWSHCPNEVLKIIEHHHEKPNGTGFPKKINGTQIDTLCAIFNVAHDVASILIEHKHGSNLKAIFEKLSEEYAGHAHFEEPLKILLEEIHLTEHKLAV
jgi:response regulator RpfG family c-di-GMP phosphodiesterase